MEDLVKPALKAVLETEEIKLFPKKIENTYRHWLENIRDWNVSRQLWWGQQIPAFYYGDHKEDYVVAENMDKALIIAKEKSGNVNLSLKDLRQDTDALDTWFSSWLWPISVFDGIRNPDNKEINYYYPTNDLVTGPDIIFFWVARMIFAGYEFRNDKPFNNVYFTGIVRDHQGRKMSKQLGNSPDALKLIEDYSADAVRAGMMLLSSGAGNDLLFDETKLQQGKAFINKITNAYRLVSGWEISDAINQPASSKIAIEWYQSKFQRAYAEMEDHFFKYRLSDSLMTLYKLIWDDFCSWLLEMVKPGYQQPIDRATYDAIILAFENNLKVLHPFMPFITEEIWHQIAPRTQEEALIISRYPSKDPVNNTVLNDFEIASEVISGIRTIRKEKNISFKEPIKLFVINNIGASPSLDAVIKKMGNVEHLEYISEKMGGALTYRVKSNEYFIPMEGSVNVENEIEKLSNELTYTEGFLKSIQAKLTNERFVNNAPEKVVASEKQKEADALAKITTLKNSLSSLIK